MDIAVALATKVYADCSITRIHIALAARNGEALLDRQSDSATFPMPRKCPFAQPDEYQAAQQTPGLSTVRLWDGRWAWLATRWADVKEVMSNPLLSGSPLHPGFPFISESLETLMLNEKPVPFSLMDDPEHSRLRRMLAPMFTMSRMRDLRPRVAQIVDEAIGQAEETGPPADFVADLALVIPSRVICELLGIPYKDHEFFQEAARQRIDLTVGPEVPLAAGRAMDKYIASLLEAKNMLAEPEDDLLGRILRDQVRPGHLSLDEAVGIARLILNAGFETTANALALGTVLLLTHPDQLEELQRDVTVLPTAVEEILRFTSVAQFQSVRVATEDVVIGGQLVAAGEGVIAPTTAGNFDPAVFRSPETFDIRRSPNRHIAFASGIHQCLGQPLARLELEVALEMILARLPGLQLAVPFEELPFRENARAYGLDAMPITW